MSIFKLIEEKSEEIQKRLAEKIKKLNPDVLTLDVEMPKMNGLEVTKQVKGTPELEKTKIILLTAKGQDSDRETGEAAGADDYMTKPFSPPNPAAAAAGQ